MKKLSVKEVSECCGAELRACGEVYGTMWFECGECRKHCDPSETNEPPVESVSQPKAVDGYLKEFDDYMRKGFHDHAIKFPEAENTQFESGFDVAQEIAESFLKSSIERARREGVEKERNLWCVAVQSALFYGTDLKTLRNHLKGMLQNKEVK